MALALSLTTPMLRKVVAVARPLGSSFTIHPKKLGVCCWKCGLSETTLPFCKQCGILQDVPTDLNLFEILDLPVSLLFNEQKLKAQYLDLTSQVHPDKFVHGNALESIYSLRWSTAINRAFKVIKVPIQRGAYILSLFSRQLHGSSHVPVDLAEQYFELKELKSSVTMINLLKFKTNLEQQQKKILDEFEQLARIFNFPPTTDLLDRLESCLHRHQFVQSMLRDLNRSLE